ncbi:CCA tRNA nucleotidyltransferase, mitochondrial [Tilletia horrida]|uniref:CCA tRNA nucleotidyltransferase, mitochondrial n=1 Tax=Tilletia horrida TaxID=155126 RepID=A0AAN6GF97_9BASI|nr:CCA tRNA nucleotidyltransferase, mitochondrial [Tilletia horrida]
MTGPPTLTLTQAEANIAAVLRETCNWITTARPQRIAIPGANPQHDPEVEVVNADTYAQIDRIGHGQVHARIAGGWVRDKLLQRESDDLDVSLSSLTGFTFAHFLSAYLASPEFASSELAARIASSTGSAAHAKATSSIAKIAANPEQSKNLETATAKVFGLSLDFVNLRKEVYEGDTRIPIMSFGTAQEDAERRDITINSLFYNVHTEQVEDLTGKGLDDLRLGLVRTPLPAYQTFLDDPLRVLRCIRFAARFRYIFHPDIVRCLSLSAQAHPQLYTRDKRVFGLLEGWTQERDGQGDDGDVERARVELHLALKTKVSRERFGIEVDKMIRGPDPLRAITLIIALELFPTIFHPPASPILSSFLPFHLDPDTPAFNPSLACVDAANKATAAAGKGQAMSPGVPEGVQTAKPAPSVLAFHAATRLQAIWDRARGQTSSFTPTSGADVEMASEPAATASTADDDDVTALARALSSTPRKEDDAAEWTSLLPRPLLDVLLDAEQRARLFMAAALLPVEHVGVVEPVGGGGGTGAGKAKKVKLVWAGEAVVSNGLKLGNKQAKDPQAALLRARHLLETVRAQREQFLDASADAGAAAGLGLPGGVWPEVEVAGVEGAAEGARELAKFGLLLRQPSLTSSANQLSPASALVFSLVARLAHLSLDGAGSSQEEDITREYVWLWERFTQGSLLLRAEEKPVLDGNQIKTVLGFHPGPLTPRIQTAILAWQLAHPGPSPTISAEACAKWLKEAWERGEIVTVENRQGASAGGGKKKGRAAPSAAGTGEGAGAEQSRKRQKSEEKA